MCKGLAGNGLPGACGAVLGIMAAQEEFYIAGAGAASYGPDHFRLCRLKHCPCIGIYTESAFYGHTVRFSRIRLYLGFRADSF